jgi:hypothetical protein
MRIRTIRITVPGNFLETRDHLVPAGNRQCTVNRFSRLTDYSVTWIGNRVHDLDDTLSRVLPTEHTCSWEKEDLKDHG